MNPGARATVQAHSYGSVTSTYGLARTNAFDSFVAFGSPGLPEKAEAGGWWGWLDGELALNVPEGERYYAEAFGDFVAASGKVPLAGLAVSPDSFLHGPSPEYWGFDRLPTREVDGYDNSTGHSQYLNPGTSFQRALAAITAGHPEEVPGR